MNAKIDKQLVFYPFVLMRLQDFLSPPLATPLLLVSEKKLFVRRLPAASTAGGKYQSAVLHFLSCVWCESWRSFVCHVWVRVCLCVRVPKIRKIMLFSNFLDCSSIGLAPPLLVSENKFFIKISLQKKSPGPLM